MNKYKYRSRSRSLSYEPVHARVHRCYSEGDINNEINKIKVAIIPSLSQLSLATQNITTSTSRGEEAQAINCDVLNEYEMAQINSGMRLIGRGLHDLPTDIKVLIQNSLDMASDWLKELIKELSKGSLSAFTHKMMEMTFGDDYSNVENDPEGLRKDLLRTLRKLKEYIKEINELNAWRIIVVEGGGPRMGRDEWRYRTLENTGKYDIYQ